MNEEAKRDEAEYKRQWIEFRRGLALKLWGSIREYHEWQKRTRRPEDRELLEEAAELERQAKATGG